MKQHNPQTTVISLIISQLSEIELEAIKTGALQGNRKAALLLGTYFEKIVGDAELSKHWYRIGAQNGCPESQYRLGQILSAKEDRLDQIRGQFWLERAIKNRNINSM